MSVIPFYLFEACREPGCPGKVIITLNIRLQDLADSFENVEPAGLTACTYYPYIVVPPTGFEPPRMIRR